MGLIRQKIVFKPPQWTKCPSCTVNFDKREAMQRREQLMGMPMMEYQKKHFGDFCFDCKAV